MTCETCNGTGWLCAATDKPSDEEHGTCCKPWEDSEFGFQPGDGCPSANGCPDCPPVADGAQIVVPCPWVPARGGMPARRRQRRRWRRLTKPERDRLRTAGEKMCASDHDEPRAATTMLYEEDDHSVWVPACDECAEHAV